ncbi:glycosyltransferase family 2 protein [Methylobacterium sp. P31]
MIREMSCESRDRSRVDVPRIVLDGLSIVAFAYGLALVAFLPWSMYDALMAADRTGPSYLLGMFLVMIGGLIMGRWSAIQYFSLIKARWFPDPVAEGSDEPFISILVPAYNETETIIPAIQSLTGLSYPAYEVIVVDDGSSDDTYAKALTLEGQYPRCTVRVLSKPNGGKWSALNAAYRESRGEYVLCVDADSRLSRTALSLLVRRMNDPGVVGVAGQVTVRNRDSILTRLQGLEYVVGNGSIRQAMSELGLVVVVPGPIGLYRREVMERIAEFPTNQRVENTPGAVQGPLSGETFAEDMQLSLSALALGGRDRLRTSRVRLYQSARPGRPAVEPALPLDARHVSGASDLPARDAFHGAPACQALGSTDAAVLSSGYVSRAADELLLLRLYRLCGRDG